MTLVRHLVILLDTLQTDPPKRLKTFRTRDKGQIKGKKCWLCYAVEVLFWHGLALLVHLERSIITTFWKNAVHPFSTVPVDSVPSTLKLFWQPIAAQHLPNTLRHVCVFKA